jgi:hypothetical protein
MTKPPAISKADSDGLPPFRRSAGLSPSELPTAFRTNRARYGEHEPYHRFGRFPSS